MSPKAPFNLLSPEKLPCKPILMVGLPSNATWAESMSHILIHNLLYASTSTYMSGGSDYEAKLKHLLSLNGDDLLLLVNDHAASTILSETQIYYPKSYDVNKEKIGELERGDYQAVIVDDTCFIREPDVTAFVMKQYSKAHFIVGGGELFTEYLCPEDYEDEEDYPDGPPPPTPGSTVITSLGESKSVSYFGFANSLDVSYGAILLKLCYAKAPHHSPTSSSSIAETKETYEESTPAKSLKSKMLWMVFLIVLFYISFELFLRKRVVSDDNSGEIEL
ncbi:hypothetical protein ACHAWT_003336 [Skeletonema menzelii]